MTDHDKKISGVEAPVNPVQQQAGPSEGRRRLMKGALAAPAVMTLMHGRLAAAMSISCDAKLSTPVEGDGINWVDASGNPLVWEDSKLGYYDEDNNFIEATYSTTESCLASLTGN